MEYVSQFPIMRDKAVAAGVPFEDVQNYYRGRLTDYSTPSFHATPLERQYNAEWVTWVAFCAYNSPRCLSGLLCNLLITQTARGKVPRPQPLVTEHAVGRHLEHRNE